MTLQKLQKLLIPVVFQQSRSDIVSTFLTLVKMPPAWHLHLFKSCITAMLRNICNVNRTTLTSGPTSHLSHEHLCSIIQFNTAALQ